MRGGGGGSYAWCLWGHPAARGGTYGASRWTETAPTSPVRWERGFGNKGPLLARHGFIVKSFRLHFLTIGDGQGCHCCLRLCNPGKLTQMIHQSKSGRFMWLDTSYYYSKQLNRKVAERNSFMEEVKLERERQQKVICVQNLSFTSVSLCYAYYGALASASIKQEYDCHPNIPYLISKQ